MKEISFVLLQERIKNITINDLLKLFFLENRIKFYEIFTIQFLKYCLRSLEDRPRFIELQQQEFFTKFSNTQKESIKGIIDTSHR